MPITMGIHHITAFVSDVQGNVDFYTGVLGLRLVKKTINYDVPDVYHLYFGNEKGSPGTIMTFFPQEDAQLGTIGGGQVGVTVFAVPPRSLLYWRERLSKYGIQTMENTRFGEEYIRFTDNSGLLIDLVERIEGRPSGWTDGGVPIPYAIKGFGGAMLFSAAASRTQAVLEDVLGLTLYGEEEGLMRFKASGDVGNWIDISTSSIPRGEMGAGTVHHIAWRAKDEQEQRQWREVIEMYGMHPTDVKDRQYFKAMYFREPGGILFEIATDSPGFDVDEPGALLGSTLKLPEWLEPQREQIERQLKPFEIRSLEN